MSAIIRGSEKPMLRFTKRADYGLMAIHYIAVHDGPGTISAKRIAEEFGIPPELLAKVLQRLAQRRLLVSQNGSKGGYAPARQPNETTEGEAMRALEGPISIESCRDHVGVPATTERKPKEPAGK